MQEHGRRGGEGSSDKREALRVLRGEGGRIPSEQEKAPTLMRARPI